MNYYQELGLKPSASVAEIRQAYKSLARLLHPDYQCEEALRKVAELQMMRLNEILGVLTDPPQRQEYDDSIRILAIRPSLIDPENAVWKHRRLGPFRIRIGAIAWSPSLVFLAVALSFTLLYLEYGPTVPAYEGNSLERTNPSRAAGSVTPAIREHAANMPRGRRPTQRVVKRDTFDAPRVAAEVIAVHPPDSLEATQRVTSPAGSGMDNILAEGAQPIPAQVSGGAETPRVGPIALSRALSPRCPLVGTWLYATSSLDGRAVNSLAYRPEYIEMVVTSEGRETISGRYLGRFIISDRALSSEISFTFHGTVGEGTTLLPWHDTDGGEGVVRVKIVSDIEIEVSWYTTRFGTTRKLASGSAILRRG